MRCKWLSRDCEGRPSCEHGKAIKGSLEGGYQRWRCPLKARQAQQRYDATPAGRERYRRRNRTTSHRLSQELYELTRIRLGR